MDRARGIGPRQIRRQGGARPGACVEAAIGPKTPAMDTGLLGIFFELVRVVLRLFSIVLIVYVVISWLYAFDIVDRRNAFVRSTWEFCRRLTDPVLAPLRRLIPPVANVDLSVMVLLLLVWLVGERLTYWLEGLLRGGPVL